MQSAQPVKPVQSSKTAERLLTQWKDNYESALDLIETYRKPLTGRTVQMNEFVEWMITTEISPYSYLPFDWASSVYNATSFAELLDEIHYALHHGCITFVTVNGAPRITFASPGDDDFRDQVITPIDRDTGERMALMKRPSDITIDVLDITLVEFTQMCDEKYEIKRLKRDS